MSLVKIRDFDNIIVDFSQGKISKYKIKKSLRQAEVCQIKHSNEQVYLVTNHIVVGMFNVTLVMLDADPTKNKLAQYTNIRANIRDGARSPRINLRRDSRFNRLPWVTDNQASNLKLDQLIDIILYLKRLDNLRAFS